MESLNAAPLAKGQHRLALLAFGLGLAFHFWGAMVGWKSKSLPGVEFRQAQTAISTYYIKQNNDFSLAYPTPVLGKPWSIPMEFPLYQWTVVVVSKGTGLGLTKSARAVSIACFYLTLPALFLLLGRWKIAVAHRWLVLAVVVTCPFYVFYSRAFLIETMALMFSVWFAVAFGFAVEKRNYAWLAVAVFAGVGGGLVKVTTFALYLLPCAGWALGRLWRGRQEGRWRSDLGWMAGAVIVPLAAALWWIHFADLTKAANPMADFLSSDNLRDFNLGTWTTRFSPELWRLKVRIVTEQLSWWPVLVLCAGLAAVGARSRRREIGLCLGLFGAALLVFPVLYAFHEYYFVANTLMLLLAMGLAVVGLAEAGAGTWVVMLCLMSICGGQAYRYFTRYYDEQKTIGQGDDALSFCLRALTKPGDILVITEHDWNSMLPYYAQRRALMIRPSAERNDAQLEAAYVALAGEKIGALVISKNIWDSAALVRRTAQYGLESKPAFFCAGMAVFLPESRRRESGRRLRAGDLPDVTLAPGTEKAEESLAGQWCAFDQLAPAEQDLFRTMQPRPVRFYSTFGPKLEEADGRLRFGAHPITRLVFHLQGGAHLLRTSVSLPPAAYEASLPADKTTDGVEILLSIPNEAGNHRELYSRLLSPRVIATDQGDQAIEISFTLPQAGDVELFFGPGPQNRDTRDWISMGDLSIRNPE